MKLFAISIAALLLLGCGSVAQSDKEVAAAEFSSQQADPCAATDPERRVVIEVGENQMASICRADGIGDCLYTHALGKTFVHARPDFNSDGRKDYLIKDFSGAYGMHDVVHFMGFVGCPGEVYVKVLDDFLTDVQVKDGAVDGTWQELQVSRACFDESWGDAVAREYTMTFENTRFAYGPPNGDPELAVFCGAYEIALPAEASLN